MKFPFWGPGYFQGRTVSFREGNYRLSLMKANKWTPTKTYGNISSHAMHFQKFQKKLGEIPQHIPINNFNANLFIWLFFSGKCFIDKKT